MNVVGLPGSAGRNVDVAGVGFYARRGFTETGLFIGKRDVRVEERADGRKVPGLDGCSLHGLCYDPDGRHEGRRSDHDGDGWDDAGWRLETTKDGFSAENIDTFYILASVYDLLNCKFPKIPSQTSCLLRRR